MILEVKGVSIKSQVKASEKKANKALKNKNKINKPVFELICKNSAAFTSSFPAKPMKIYITTINLVLKKIQCIIKTY